MSREPPGSHTLPSAVAIQNAALPPLNLSPIARPTDRSPSRRISVSTRYVESDALGRDTAPRQPLGLSRWASVRSASRSSVPSGTAPSAAMSAESRSYRSARKTSAPPCGNAVK